MTGDPAAADAALDALWADFFRLRAALATGVVAPAAALDTLRTLHRAAGATGSVHVPVFRAEVRGEITLVKGVPDRRPPGSDGSAR